LVGGATQTVMARRAVSTALSAAASSVADAGTQGKDSEASKTSPIIIFVLGGPGSGKGTQCELLTERYDCVHLSAGDLLRAEQSKEGSPFSELINSCITNGKIVPVAITCQLIVQAMDDVIKSRDAAKASPQPEGAGPVFLIDGFPRNLDNLQGWESEAGHDARAVLFFEATEEVLEGRLMERGKTSGRSDDNLKSIKKRFSTFQGETMPVVEIFGKIGCLRRIDAEKDVDEVFEQVKGILASDIPELR